MGELIERLAKEAGMTLRNGVYTSNWVDGVIEDELAKFSALIAEECAKEAEEHETWRDNPAIWIAAAIRAKYPMPGKGEG